MSFQEYEDKDPSLEPKMSTGEKASAWTIVVSFLLFVVVGIVFRNEPFLIRLIMIVGIAIVSVSLAAILRRELDRTTEDNPKIFL